MNIEKGVVQKVALVGCDFGDCDKVHTLADADWLTRKLTITFGPAVRDALIAQFHRVTDFRIVLEVWFAAEDDAGQRNGSRTVEHGDVSTGPVAAMQLGFEELDSEYCDEAGNALRNALGIKTLRADNNEDMRALMKAVEKFIPHIRDYFDF